MSRVAVAGPLSRDARRDLVLQAVVDVVRKGHPHAARSKHCEEHPGHKGARERHVCADRVRKTMQTRA
jgi:hypothetical protein